MLKKIVSLGTSNAISAIEHAIKQWGKGHNISLYRIFKRPVSKLLSEEDVVRIINCDAFWLMELGAVQVLKDKNIKQL